VVHERLTREAAEAIVATTGSAGPIYAQGNSAALSFLAEQAQETVKGLSAEAFHAFVLRNVGANLERDVGEPVVYL